MVYRLNDGIINKYMGNKAKGLIKLKAHGFNVPKGIVIDSNSYDEIIEFNGISDSINELLEDIGDNYDTSDIEKISNSIEVLFDNIILPDDIVCALNANIYDGVKYAVRSSGLKEDLLGHSFAGQYETYLDVEDKDNVIEAILKCYKSLFSKKVLTYLIDNNINFEDLKMAVVVQEMVDSQFSGVIFTVNPITGNDKEIVAEVIKGQGEQYVSGKVNAATYYYNWYENKLDLKSEIDIDKDIVKKLMNKALEVQTIWGFPCDIEYAVYENEIYFLQVRPITKINYSGLDRVWTTANFRDGGVSSKVCTRFMYSLYEIAWNDAMPKYLKETKLVDKHNIPDKIIEMYYGRPYWDLTTVKGGASRTPGFKEREFDAQYSIRPNYEGDGIVTDYTPATMIRGIKILNSQKKNVSHFLSVIDKHKEKYINVYNEFLENIDEINDIEELQNKWIELINDHYLKCESFYFWLIYVNTIEQAVNKKFYAKYVNDVEYLGLISGIDNISHMKPFIDSWKISREIRANEEEHHYWIDNDTDTIVNRITENIEYMPCIKDFIKKYGYHSNRELDITYPCFDEDLKCVVENIKEQVKLEDSYAPMIELENQKKYYKETLENVKKRVSKSTFEKFTEKLDRMRYMLWWREELKDMSTRYYHLIRKYTLKLAKKYVEMGILVDENEIWNLSKNDIIRFINKELSISDLDKIIDKNRKYYNSFRNYENETEIGNLKYDDLIVEKNNGIYGVGCNNGIVTAKARVISDITEIERLEKNDILVTKFTDTGWTSKFSKLSGIVTEFGGILCHTAIVSREYGIPCIVCAHDVMNKIKDGELITINGTTGEIKIEKQK